jgi:hypothetical protein
MKKILVLFFLVVTISLQAQTFVIKDVVMTDTTSSLLDPEIDWFGHHYCWANEQGIWVGNIDPVTGDFIPKNGKGFLVDSTPSFKGMQLVANGPEWAMSKNGSVIIYPDSVDDKIIQIGTASLIGNNWVAMPLLNSYGRIPFFGSYDNTYQKDGITCASYDIQTMKPTGMRLRNTSDTTEIIPTDMQGGRWIKGLYAISLSQEKQAPYEVGYFDVNTKSYNKVATFAEKIDQAWIVPLPEYNNTYALWCVEKKTEQDQISVFVKIQNQWQKIDSIIVPTDRKEIFSPEPFWWNGSTYLFLVARPRQDQPKSLYDQVWIVGFDRKYRLTRLISEQSPTNRIDPEVFYTTKEPVIYYTENRKGIKVIHKCATGLGDDVISYEKAPFKEMKFSKDYFPGTNDINGRYLGSTETMTIIQHKGKLFAGMGNWMDYPWQLTPENEGSQILRKDSYNTPWVVDTSLGYHSMRTDAVLSVTFNKDFEGKTLTQPVNMLVCGAGYIQDNFERQLGVWTRDDDNGKWTKNIATNQNKASGIRSFKIHTDKVTGKQWLFCGVTEGNIIKAAYDPNKEGKLVFDTSQELQNLGRVMAMCECNGDLYASAGVDMVGKDTVGGLYRRIDGVNPSWELIYRWQYNALDQGDETNIMRGITCIPDPKGTGKNVIVGTRAYPGIVEIIEPHNNHNIYTELYIKSFFSSQWDISYKGAALSAYNYFVPDTIDGKELWWQSLWVENPKNNKHPYNGSHFLVRYKDGNYQYGDIFDDKNPVPSGDRLRACRTICKSPFPEEPNTYYFGGYDAAKDTSNNTSWIYKGIITGGTSVDEAMNQDENLIVYPNPANTILFIKKQTEKISQYEIVNIFGQIVVCGIVGEGGIDILHLPIGIYFIKIGTYSEKFMVIR